MNRGRYEYHKDGQPLGVQEWFSIDGVLTESAQVRSERVSPNGVRISVDASLERGLVRDAAVTIEVGDFSKVARFSAEPRGALIFPLLRIFQGAVISAVAATGSRSVLIPYIADPTDPARVLEPTVEYRSASLVALDSSNGIRTYTYEGSVYDDRARFQIRESDLVLVSYTFPQGESILTVQHVES